MVVVVDLIRQRQVRRIEDARLAAHEARQAGTRASGGYIIRIRPMAMGMLVVPTDRPSIQPGSPGTTVPSSTPSAMAAKIHNVSQRSRKDRRVRVAPHD